MSCEEMFPQLELLVEGELSSGTEREIRAHLTACPRCASILRQLSREREDLVAALELADLPAKKLEILESKIFEAVTAIEAVSAVTPVRPAPMTALDIVVPLLAGIAAVIAMVLSGWDTQPDKVRLARAIAESREAMRMTMIVLISISATVLVVMAGRLGRLPNRVTKGEF